MIYPEERFMYIKCANCLKKALIIRTIRMQDILFCVHKDVQDEKALTISEFTTGTRLVSGTEGINKLIKEAQDTLSKHTIEETRMFIKARIKINGAVRDCLERRKSTIQLMYEQAVQKSQIVEVDDDLPF